MTYFNICNLLMEHKQISTTWNIIFAIQNLVSHLNIHKTVFTTFHMACEYLPVQVSRKLIALSDEYCYRGLKITVHFEIRNWLMEHMWIKATSTQHVSSCFIFQLLVTVETWRQKKKISTFQQKWRNALSFKLSRLFVVI